MPPDLRFLKRLVTALALVMIFGLLAIVALLVIRLWTPSPLPQLPASISLPAGETVRALTFAPDRVIVVTDSGRVLAYAPDGAPMGELELK